MARKSLLTETEIRRFMKLAEMRPVGDEKLQEFASEEQEEMPPPEGDLPPEEGEEVLDVEEEPVVDEADPEKEAMLADVVQAVADVLGVDVDVEGAGTEEEMPVEEPEGLEMGGEEMPPPGGEELGVEEEPVPGMRYETSALEVPDVGPTPKPCAEFEEGSDDWLKCTRETGTEQGEAAKGPLATGRGRAGLGGQVKSIREEDIVNEVAKRVAARLSKETQREQMVDQLAERILKRLTK